MNFTIEKTFTTPQIQYKNGALSIIGRSVPVEKQNFFHTLINNKFNNELELLEKTIDIDINISVFNAASKKGLITFFSMLEKLSSEGFNFYVKWRYEKNNEDLYELGEILKSLFSIRIELIEE